MCIHLIQFLIYQLESSTANESMKVLLCGWQAARIESSNNILEGHNG